MFVDAIYDRLFVNWQAHNSPRQLNLLIFHLLSMSHYYISRDYEKGKSVMRNEIVDFYVSEKRHTDVIFYEAFSQVFIRTERMTQYLFVSKLLHADDFFFVAIIISPQNYHD